MESMLDQFELLNFEIENDVDWVLDSEAPSLPLNRREVSEWIEKVYQNPEIDANKRLLVNALDIIVSRKHANDFRSNSHEGNPSLTPSRDLTDIQILARMQEDSLRQSTLQRTRTKNRKKSTPTEQWSADLQAELRAQTNSERIESYISAPDGYNRSFSAEDGCGQDVQNAEHENEAPSVDSFRARNYADQGTFRVKKKNSDSIKRPIIEAGHKSRPLYNYEEDEEFERTEHSVLSECSSNTNSSSLTELVAANSRMIHDTKIGEANSERLSAQVQAQQQQQRPIIRARGNNNSGNNNLIPRPSVNYSSALPTTSATAPRTQTTTVTRANTQMHQQQQQVEQKARNRSIPRVRTGIPVMSTASNSHHSAISNNGTQNGANGKPRASMAASRSISPRRRNSSGSVLTAVPPLKATSARQVENGQTANRKLQLPASLSSNNLRHARSNGRIDKMSVASSDYGLNDEFY